MYIKRLCTLTGALKLCNQHHPNNNYPLNFFIKMYVQINYLTFRVTFVLNEITLTTNVSHIV